MSQYRYKDLGWTSYQSHLKAAELCGRYDPLWQCYGSPNLNQGAYVFRSVVKRAIFLAFSQHTIFKSNPSNFRMLMNAPLQNLKACSVIHVHKSELDLYMEQ